MGAGGNRWLPSSKMTAVIISGSIYSWFIWVLTIWYETPLEPWLVAVNQTWIVGLIGWAVSENR